jgi:hypothetical protein
MDLYFEINQLAILNGLPEGMACAAKLSQVRFRSDLLKTEAVMFVGCGLHSFQRQENEEIGLGIEAIIKRFALPEQPMPKRAGRPRGTYTKEPVMSV